MEFEIVTGCDCIGAIVPLNDLDEFPLAVPPKLRRVGVRDGVCGDVLKPLPAAESVPLTDELIVDVAESVPLLLLVNDGSAPIVSDDVGD